MTLATWSIRNPVPTILIFGLLALAGVWGFSRLAIQDLPDFDFPTVTVTLSQPGAAPAQLETEIARKVEDSLSALPAVKHLRTTVSSGAVSVVVEFELSKALSDAVSETKNAVDQIRGDLPNDMQPPIVTALAINGEALMTYAVGSTRMDEEALSWFVDDTLSRAVLAVPGVGRFERIGGVQREVLVEIDPARLSGLGITAAQVSRALRLVQQESSGGRGQIGGAEQAVRTIATVGQAAELAALPLVLPNGRSVRLDEVATITDGSGERMQMALLDGKPVVGFRIYRSRGFDEVSISKGVQTALDALSKTDPSLSVTLISDTVRYTLNQYEGSMDLLYEGAFLAILVVFLFLRDWRATLISAAALPLSILPAFAAIAWLGYSLNTLTLLALAVIVGILVDDAIVEIENVERHVHMGKSVEKATEDAVNEIALAVIATTASLVVVFLPTALMSGIAGVLFQQFGWTVVIAVLASLLVARLFTPMLAARFLKPKPFKSESQGPIMRRYLAAVDWCLGHRKTTILGATAFFAVSLALLPLIPTGFIPAGDQGLTRVRIELPPGSTVERTLQTAEEARAVLSEVPGIQSVFTTVGNAGVGTGFGRQAGEVRKAQLLVILTPREDRAPQAEIESSVRKELLRVAGARFDVGNGGSGEKMQVTLASTDSQALKSSALALERELRALGTLSNITSTASLERPEIVVRPDPQLAAERGVTAASIGEALRIATGGDFDSQVAKLNLDNRQLYIRVRVPDVSRMDLDTFAALPILGRSGLVPLASVAKVSMETGPAQIDRFDRSRYVTVNADLDGMPLSTAYAQAMALPSMKLLPSTVKTISTGDTEIFEEVLSGFTIALITGFICIFCVIVLLFKDFLQPITILSAIPLSAGGAFLALLLFNIELGVPAMIGLITLMGIVTKNSILLVDYALANTRERGMPTREAVIDACRKRARPIVMTTIAMIAGMMPIAIGFGSDASFRQPMAVAVIGGLITSTALSLLVVPVVFVYVGRFEAWIGRIANRAGLSPRKAEVL